MLKLFFITALLLSSFSSSFADDFVSSVGQTFGDEQMDGPKIGPKPKNKEQWIAQDNKLGQKEFEDFHKHGHVVYVTGSHMSYNEQIRYLRKRGAIPLGDDQHVLCDNVWYEGQSRGVYCLHVRAMYIPPKVDIPNSHARLSD